MFAFADGIGAGHLNLAKLPQRFVEPQQKISYRAKKSERPFTCLYALVISNLCNVSKALQLFFEFVGVGGHFHSSLSVSG
jgi:hypothetical protein